MTRLTSSRMSSKASPRLSAARESSEIRYRVVSSSFCAILCGQLFLGLMPLRHVRYDAVDAAEASVLRKVGLEGGLDPTIPLPWTSVSGSCA